MNPLPKGRPSKLPEDSLVVLRFKRMDGQLLADYPVDVRLNSELLPSDDRVGLVDVILAVDPTARAIELLVGGQIGDVFQAGKPPPTVRAVQRISEGKDLGVGLEFDRALEENQTYSVQVSTDGGVSWNTVAVGLREPAFTLDRGQFPESAEVLVRIIATNGFTSSVVTSETLRI